MFKILLEIQLLFKCGHLLVQQTSIPFFAVSVLRTFFDSIFLLPLIECVLFLEIRLNISFYGAGVNVQFLRF